MADKCVAHMRQPHGRMNGDREGERRRGFCRLQYAEADLHCPMELAEAQGLGGLTAKGLVTHSRLRPLTSGKRPTTPLGPFLCSEQFGKHFCETSGLQMWLTGLLWTEALKQFREKRSQQTMLGKLGVQTKGKRISAAHSLLLYTATN